MRRRAPIVLLGTAAGLAGILSYHTHSSTLVAGSQPASGSSGGSSTGSSTGSSSGSSSAPPASSPGPSSSAAPTTSGPPATSAPAPATLSATGQTVQYGYGQLAVRVTVSGGRITDVTVPTLQVAEYTSQYIAQQAIPMLKRQVLSAQSANIQGVSGATYTSQAYAQSLQSALSRAKQG